MSSLFLISAEKEPATEEPFVQGFFVNKEAEDKQKLRKITKSRKRSKSYRRMADEDTEEENPSLTELKGTLAEYLKANAPKAGLNITSLSRSQFRMRSHPYQHSPSHLPSYDSPYDSRYENARQQEPFKLQEFVLGSLNAALEVLGLRASKATSDDSVVTSMATGPPNSFLKTVRTVLNYINPQLMSMFGYKLELNPAFESHRSFFSVIKHIMRIFFEKLVGPIFWKVGFTLIPVGTPNPVKIMKWLLG